jgi:hypothetical protein
VKKPHGKPPNPREGYWLYLHHIYIGSVYQGCIEAKNPLHAVSMWAKMKGIGQVILRAERASDKPVGIQLKPNKVLKRLARLKKGTS